MSEGLKNHPLRNEVLSEFQSENDLLGVTSAFRGRLAAKADEKLVDQETAELESERVRLQREADQTRAAIDHDAPITPAMYQYGDVLQLCLRREHADLGLALPGSTIAIASSKLGSGEYTPEDGFTMEQVNAVLSQLARYMSFSDLY
ncbi:MAG TPA: hypothetical protein VMT23_01890 [Candidatus Binatia bacterium]|nr:hypothetical protein [Candidatus Binatia bacterium]